jgi:hypothetical protein
MGTRRENRECEGNRQGVVWRARSHTPLRLLDVRTKEHTLEVHTHTRLWTPQQLDFSILAAFLLYANSLRILLIFVFWRSIQNCLWELLISCW